MILNTKEKALWVFKHARQGLILVHGIPDDKADAWARVAAFDYLHAVRMGEKPNGSEYMTGVLLSYYASQAVLGMPAIRLRRYHATGATLGPRPEKALSMFKVRRELADA